MRDRDIPASSLTVPRPGHRFFSNIYLYVQVTSSGLRVDGSLIEKEESRVTVASGSSILNHIEPYILSPAPGSR